MGYTKFEKARIIGARALQISLGAPVLVEANGEKESLELAKMEFEKGIIPVTVKENKEEMKKHYFGEIET
ncbi:MAG: DNA-directed RNA polymerase subunit K/omega [Candidatus Methanohalarchaeum thermophilum]|uniref:DNA-directed RNA polymerase subunit Rpo6 n=1 Tax=Methanohalarchaeum thermophilum TaxID=1903181 RepID=A0A1Q6DRY7_METT1|nr:MAG: DNA-directed RNA polymerase subunit K/omega [Candidatus Methanohalarchaeum thermophilum]